MNRGVGSIESERIMAHLLLIDDDPGLIPDQIQSAFPGTSHRLDLATSGMAGLELIRTDPPHVVLLDIRLPDMSGLDVCHGIREIDARIPIIFVTIAKTADTAIEAMKGGAFDYLFKPLALLQLRKVVGEALEVSRLMALGRSSLKSCPIRTSMAPSWASARRCAKFIKRSEG